MNSLPVRLVLVIAFASLIGVVGCGGGSGGNDDDTTMEDPPQVYDISGKILEDDGSPIVGAFVTARLGDESRATIATATSDADGRYSVRITENTAFFLHVEKAAYVNTNSYIRELTATVTGFDIVLLLKVRADSLLMVLGGPATLTVNHFLFFTRAVDSMGNELSDVTVNVTPIGLLIQYRQADDTGYTNTAPTVACTAGGGCALPQMAGFSTPVDQGISIFRLTHASMGILASVAAPLVVGEVTYIDNE